MICNEAATYQGLVSAMKCRAGVRLHLEGKK